MLFVRNMDWDIRRNRKYLLLLLVFCALIPHLALCLLQIASASDFLSPVEVESYANFFVCQWLPFWLAFLPYLRLQKRDTFSLLPALLGTGIVLSFIGRFETRSVLTVAKTIPLVLTVETSALLKKAEGSGNRALAGIAANRGMLRSFFFWSVAFLCVAHISSEACTWYTTVVSPFLTLPIPGILLFDAFHRQNNQPLTCYGCIGMLILVPLSLFLVTIGPMQRFQLYHLMGLGIGFGILFMLLIVYHLDQWKKAKP